MKTSIAIIVLFGLAIGNGAPLSDPPVTNSTLQELVPAFHTITQMYNNSVDPNIANFIDSSQFTEDSEIIVQTVFSDTTSIKRSINGPFFFTAIAAATIAFIIAF